MLQHRVISQIMGLTTLLAVAGFGAIVVYTVIESPIVKVDEQTQIKKMVEDAARLRYPDAKYVLAYQVKMSLGEDTGSPFKKDVATVHVTMQFDTEEVTKYFWLTRYSGQNWQIVDVIG
ncbi:hypothetical protein [Paenibacillus xerothermodurans]|uniref:Uncharacterized protein n=1 Tax=Paenibacillus xerothermodurans TaxID=1977292 RepID=A0A2W1NDB6_PAEXE|nr:hypothetical protein [Paenibacillus xerothermodurans]PZE21610.1 hypothetical protein CBW46_004060 [Paenibacillus xerothermodurans]